MGSQVNGRAVLRPYRELLSLGLPPGSKEAKSADLSTAAFVLKLNKPGVRSRSLLCSPLHPR